jgi:hypothetical protein
MQCTWHVFLCSSMISILFKLENWVLSVLDMVVLYLMQLLKNFTELLKITSLVKIVVLSVSTYITCLPGWTLILLQYMVSTDCILYLLLAYCTSWHSDIHGTYNWKWDTTDMHCGCDWQMEYMWLWLRDWASGQTLLHMNGMLMTSLGLISSWIYERVIQNYY